MQEALPREMYVDEAAWRVERDAVLYGEWFCVGRRDALGLAEPARVAVRRRGRRVGAGHQRRAGRAARGVQRLPPPRQPDRCPRPARPACQAAALRCPYHSWTYGLDGRLLRRRTPSSTTPRRSRSPRSASRPGAASSSCTSRRSGPGRSRSRSLARPPPWPTTASRTSWSEPPSPTTWRPTTRCPRELQRVLPLRPGASRAVPAGAVVHRGRLRPRLGRRHPAPRGRLDLHDHGHHHPRARCPAWTPRNAPGTRATSSTPT